jgi:hypothetical protein
MSGINHINTNPKEIGPLLKELEEVLIGHKKGHCILACITMAIVVQNDKLSTEQMVAAVKDVSELIALHASQVKDDRTH